MPAGAAWSALLLKQAEAKHIENKRRPLPSRGAKRCGLWLPAGFTRGSLLFVLAPFTRWRPTPQPRVAELQVAPEVSCSSGAA